jgi:SAM-dependent methyltransferase
MQLKDLIERTPIPEPWAEGDNIPWNEPGFSGRMLAEHLTQDHDAASRRFEIVDEHAHWIHEFLLEERSQRVLDLGCGPGLYASRLARFGHTCTGIDFSPASIQYARQEAEREGLNCTYIEADVRKVDYGGPFDFAMFLYGEFNVFKTVDIDAILDRLQAALKPGGLLLLEPQQLEALERARQAPALWRANRTGLFSDQPHLYLYENFWDDRSRTLTTRYWVIDAATAEVTRYAQTAQGYTDDGLELLLDRHGFRDVHYYPALAPQASQVRQEFFGVTAVRA